MIRNTREALPGIVSDAAGVPEMKSCPCRGSLAGRLLTGWEAGPYSGRTVLECHDCGRREAIVRRVLAVAPEPERRKMGKKGTMGKLCKRPACGKTFYDRRNTEPREYCSVSCANGDRAPSQRGVGQAPKFYGRGGGA